MLGSPMGIPVRRFRFLLTHAVTFVAAWIVADSFALSNDPIGFGRDVRPILSDACFQCHGPDSQTREGGLRLDIELEAKADRGGYAAIIAGDIANSEVLRRIDSDDPDERMPPPDSGVQLSPSDRETLRRWIEAGAEYERHWAFTRVEKPKAPSPGNPVDGFIAQRLLPTGLAPSPPATAEVQLRRVTLDLTGLPPLAEELERFLRDISRRGLEVAYHDAVARLLATPRHAEQMAWHWLEAARYADTDGYQNDGPREMWRWRDWVIDAFARNMPFDQFTIEQLAGDLLPSPSLEQRIATAFNRNHRYNSEEGIPIDEFLLENAVDRVDTTSTVWMGMTVGCARCHDHKYDPISQREYYQLIDYFNDVAESGRAVKEGNSEPWILTPTAEQSQHLAGLRENVVRAQMALADAEPEIAVSERSWLKSRHEEGETAGEPILPVGLDHHFILDGEGVGETELGRINGLIGNGRFSIAFWMTPGRVDQGAVLSNEMADTERKGILVEFADARLRWHNITRWIGGVSTIETRRTFEPGQRVHVTLTNDGTQRADGMTIYIDGIAEEVEVLRNTNSNRANRGMGAEMRIGWSPHVGRWSGQLSDLRFYTTRTLEADEAVVLAVSDSIDRISSKPAKLRTPAEAARLRMTFLEQAASPKHSRLLTNLREARATLTAYEDQLPTTMIMQDLPDGRPSHVRVRGVYDQLGERVTQDVPAFLPPLPSDQPNDRLALARWLVGRDHPLTARVTVNRYWQWFFGRGLVDTAEDFGSQGESPTHPELLDWLAAEFMDSGWDLRQLITTIVTSQTYRQGSVVMAEHLAVDPDNLLLARAPRLALHGNILRDQALALSGLLVERVGGASVYPYQPAGMWEEASNAKYTLGKGSDLYRRSLYTYWKRTLAPPTMAVLDTADREYCSVKPKRTNTPLQALTLLNDVTFFEAARGFAERILVEGGSNDSDRITFAFRSATSRMPKDEELELLIEAMQIYRVGFDQDPEGARQMVRIGNSRATKQLSESELAAATALANVILNLEEVTTRP